MTFLKKLRSQSPDTIVAVGKGDEMKEFECYHILLCFASEYFDAMFSHLHDHKNHLHSKVNDKSRIELPDKNPKEWEMFYTFIDPSTIATASVTKDNAFILASWFHEYKMNSLLDQCDEIISKKEYFEQFIGVNDGDIRFSFLRSSFWTNVITTNEDNLKSSVGLATAEKLFEYLAFCKNHSLKKSLQQALEELGRFLCTGFDLLLLHQDLTKKAVDAFETNREYLEETITNESLNFYNDLTMLKGVDWESTILQPLIQAKLENIIMKRRVRPFDQFLEEDDDCDSDYCESDIDSDDLFWESDTDVLDEE